MLLEFAESGRPVFRHQDIAAVTRIVVGSLLANVGYHCPITPLKKACKPFLACHPDRKEVLISCQPRVIDPTIHLPDYD